MSGHTQLWLLVVVAWLCVFNTAAYASYPSISLPDWRSNAGYLTRCDFDDDTAPFCDWTAEGLTRSQTRPGKFYLARDPGSLSGMARLQSRFLNSSEDLCLQFWYYKPHQDSSELRVSLSDEVRQTEIWSSLASESHAWRQVLIPLSYSHLNGAQIVFRLMQGHGNKEEIIFDKIGILRGQCGMQCQSGTQLWTDESTQCTCTEGQLTCTQIICGDGQTCRQAVTSTVSSGTCRVASDLRYRTFDGVNFRFMGPCAYILTKVCDGVSVVPGFAVEVQKEQRRNSSVSMIQQVKVNLQGLRVTLLRRDRRRIMVNGIWKNLPLSLYGDTVKVSAQGPVVELQTHFNLSVSYAKSGALHVTVPNQFSDKLCGMCGNFNHVMDDDHKMVNGSLAENGQVLGQSWKSADPPCEEPTTPSMCSEAEQLEYASEAYCGVLLSPHGPFSECPSALGAVSFFRSCVFEMCSTQGDPETFCDVLQAFAKTCNDAGIPVTGWRNATYCPLACGAHSHFNACSSECAGTCSMLDAPENCGTCEERCECDDGFLRSGEKCVPRDDCGCWVDGQHYGKGETFMQGDCKKQCLCAGQGTVQCSDASCVAHEVCKVKDEVLGCFPSSPVTCSIYGDPHYITFDGKAYSFRGTCNYTIAKTCTATAASFTLTARNEGRSNSSSLNSVALEVEELHLVIRKNRLVYVNGSQVTLPYSHSTSVKVLQKGPYVQVDTNFGLRFLFNGNDRLFVQLDERHMGTTCGLCGTYSGSQFDDFLTPDGNVVPYPHDFASSWNTHDKDWTCSNGSAEDPECPPELDSEGFRECSKLLGEAFKACHWFVPPQIFVNSCVSDHCTSGGDLSQLCTSLQNYVAACEVAEVFLADWWKDTVCAVIPTRPPTDPATPKTTQPTTSTPPAASCPWSCNFDQNECGWEQLIQDSFNWTRWSGPTPTDYTGPTSDHTTGSGYYMYIEADGVHYGDSARMMSPVCNTLGTQCLTFWYHIYGWATAMALNVYKLDGNQATKIWSRLNNQGNSWQLAQIEVNSQGPFQIIVEGIRGSDVGSDVAWDDIAMTYGKCGKLSVSLNPETSSPTHGNQAFITPALFPSAPSLPGSSSSHPVCRIDCDFENNLCTWNQLLTDVFDWTRHSGYTPTPLTGPSFDHTTGSGHYIYIEGDSATHGDTARLLSEECTDQQPQCLQFWYHMYGSSWTMGLTVYLLHGNQAWEVWRKTEDQGNTWHRALVNLIPEGNFKIIFEGRRGDNAWSDVAVDDISLHRGTCEDVVQTTAEPVHTTAKLFRTTAVPVHNTAEPFQTTAEPFQTAVEPVHTTAEPVHITAEPVQTTAELVHITAKPFQTTAEPVQTTAEPVHITAKPFQTTAEPFQTTAEPVHITAEPVQTTAEPVQTTAEPVHITAKPFQTTAEPVHITAVPVQTTARPVHITAVPVQTTVEPVHITAKPFQTTAEPVHITAEPVQTTAEPVHITAEPFQTTAEPFQTAVEPVQTTAEPVHITAKPFQTTAEPVHITAEPVQTTAEPVHITAKPFQTTAEPVHITAEPFQTTAEPVHTTAEPVQTTAEPVQTTAEPVHTTAEPVQTTAEPVQTTAEVGHTTAEPFQTKAKPVQTTAEPFQTTTEPFQTKAEPVQTTIEPVHSTAEPVHSTAELFHTTTDPYHSCVTKPVQISTEPVHTTAEPVQISTEPVHTTAQPLQTTAEPLQTTAQPLQTTAQPLQTTAEPLQTTAEPLQTTAEPLQTTAKPLQTTAQPLQTTAQPLQTTAEPLQTTAEPLQTTAEPLQTTAKPLQTTAKPLQTTAEPLQTTAKPLQTTAKPLQTTAEPLQTTAEPLQTTAKPLQTTAEPLQTTAEPLHTTAKPVHATTEPVHTTTEPVHSTTESFQTTTEPVHTTTEWDHNCVTKPVHATSETVQTTVEPIQTTGSLDTVPSSTSTTARPVETTAPNTTTTTTTTTPQPTPSCPINSHYANCMPTCQPTCEQLHGAPNCNTADSCSQGCVCNDGFVLRQRVCVPIWECGCQDDNGDNHYFGETWYSPHCTQKCECKRKGSQGELKCKDKECDSNEVCLMSEQGEYSCKSADFSTCSIDDDPEYIPFDNFKHKFKGKYSYVLVQTSNLPNNVPEVYIEGINQKSREQENRDEDYDDEDLDGRERGDDGDRSEVDGDSSEEDDDDDDGRLRALRMRVYNHTVEFREGRRVMVNGVLARAPVFPTPGLKILERSSHLYLQTDFGLSVEFKGKGKAEISLPDTYKTKVGGLCGNYDGRKNNDMMKPNGQQAHNVNEFGESWRVVAEKAAVRRRRSSPLYALLGLRQ
ncbi:zonadhesin isoform X4 [Pygocentrus nattereri]|uniref:zonadhesin isoform X4 n=1 Tax=Pygocentrus nattereri TaxID=42514 RepID=UPI0018917214|nr:zonadhesin isoform X4 [Pygocentrus nattereri]